MTGRRGLTRQVVVDAAVDIVEREGAPALTLTRVAEALGVKPPSLYNHIEGLESLERQVALRAVVELGDRLGRAAMGRSGREAVKSTAHEFRAFARAHPGLYAMSARARPHDEEFDAASLRSVEPVLAILRSFGFEADESIHAARMLRSSLHGFVALEQIGGFGIDVDLDESFAWLVDRLVHALEEPALETRH